jgi:hypothetical protein
MLTLKHIIKTTNLESQLKEGDNRDYINPHYRTPVIYNNSLEKEEDLDSNSS